MDKAGKRHPPMDIRTKMYIVLACCCAVLLLTTGAALFIVHGIADASGSESPVQTVDSAPMVVESGYDMTQNTIDTTQYSSTILEPTDDAGQSYVDETLFLGDSNTARMYRLFDYCSYQNAIGSVGMTARSLASYACAKFSGSSSYVTMAQAVAMMQPRRVIITFGTNDLGSSASTEKFIADYQAGIESIVQAYPSVDIIVNAIPPLGQSHSNEALTQAQVDEFNKAIVEMCQQKGWKFLNSAEVLKDPATGYAKAGYVEASDGIHLTRSAMDALFGYVRTHSYITEDDRPTLSAVPTHLEDKDVVVYTAPVVATPEPTQEPQEEEPESEPESTPEPETTPTPTPVYTYVDTVVPPTCTEQGYTHHECVEDPSKSYNDTYVNAPGHTFQNGVCTVCGAADPAYVAPTPEPTPTPTPEPAPTDPPASDPPPADTASADGSGDAAPAGEGQ